MKRAYGRLIRIYKPETHPGEFQRIRRAYEQLEHQVRYGIEQNTIAAQTDAWSSVLATDASQAPPAEPGDSPSTSPQLVAERAIQEPRATYRVLRQSTDKSPQDYFVLAVLSDLVAGDESHSFLKWVLKGLQQFPSDVGLQQLLREYLRTDVAPASAASILAACSKTLAADAF